MIGLGEEKLATAQLWMVPLDDEFDSNWSAMEAAGRVPSCNAYADAPVCPDTSVHLPLKPYSRQLPLRCPEPHLHRGAP